jgi:prepilin peptidase CpaA
MNQIDSMLELLRMLLSDPRYSVLFTLLLLASISDCRSYRIPNWLTLGGTAFALAYSVAVPFSPRLGFGWALGGMALGLCFMLPLYVLGVMGAGDVKLMAMVGAFLGLYSTLYAVLFVFAVGGFAAVVYAVWSRSLVRMAGNVRRAVQTMAFSTLAGLRPAAAMPSGASIGRMPYAVSISLGTLAYVLAQQLGYA